MKTENPQAVETLLNSGWMNGFLCTSNPVQKMRFWYGDSGGPVFSERGDGTFTQLSLVSWNTPEDSEIEWYTDYDMSVDVLFYLDWIEENMV
jgi:secreted trypsin-like serine protease